VKRKNVIALIHTSRFTLHVGELRDERREKVKISALSAGSAVKQLLDVRQLFAINRKPSAIGHPGAR